MKRHLIQRVDVGATPVAAFEFNVSSLPVEYTNLIIEVSARSTSTVTYFWENLFLSFNNQAGTWETSTLARNNNTPYGAHTTYSGYNPWAGAFVASNGTTSAFGMTTIIIPDWRSTHYKPVMIEATATGANYGVQAVNAGRWNSNDAITSIKIHMPGTHTFAQYSSATLYGITSGSNGTTTVS